MPFVQRHIIIAGGFGELGEEGKKLQDEVTQTARKNGIRLIGPNTSGMMNLKANLNLVGMRDAPKGDIALLTQSGNMALTLITEAKTNSQKGFSYYVGVGNEADINFHEYLAHFRTDLDTRARANSASRPGINIPTVKLAAESQIRSESGKAPAPSSSASAESASTRHA